MVGPESGSESFRDGCCVVVGGDVVLGAANEIFPRGRSMAGGMYGCLVGLFTQLGLQGLSGVVTLRMYVGRKCESDYMYITRIAAFSLL